MFSLRQKEAWDQFTEFKKKEGILQQKPLHSYISFNISRFICLFVVYFRAMLKKIRIFFLEFWFGNRNVLFTDFT